MTRAAVYQILMSWRQRACVSYERRENVFPHYRAGRKVLAAFDEINFDVKAVKMFINNIVVDGIVVAILKSQLYQRHEKHATKKQSIQRIITIFAGLVAAAPYYLFSPSQPQALLQLWRNNHLHRRPNLWPNSRQPLRRHRSNAIRHLPWIWRIRTRHLSN
jgi:hypothetical protein